MPLFPMATSSAEASLPDQSLQMGLSKSDCTYTHCYCEENVYILCQKLEEQGLARRDYSDLLVAFISNPARKVLLWRQQAGHGRYSQVCWDYHVVCVQVTPEDQDAVVWDLDSQLPFPVPLMDYVQEALWAGKKEMLHFANEYTRLFRLVAAAEFLSHFASDRSHMVDPVTRQMYQPPPTYPCLVAQNGATNNLEDYISMRFEDVEMLDSMEEEEGEGQTDTPAGKPKYLALQNPRKTLSTFTKRLEVLRGRATGIVLDELGLLFFFFGRELSPLHAVSPHSLLPATAT